MQYPDLVLARARLSPMRAFVLVCCLGFGSCTHVCAKSWEVGGEYTASPYFGPGYSTRMSVGGELGKECRTKEE
jgi:hypothetical protein